MSVQNIGGGTPAIPGDDDRAAPLPLPGIESMKGQPDEPAARAAIESRYGGPINRATARLDSALSIVGFTPIGPSIPSSFNNLPSFEIQGKDGTRVSSELDEIKGPDGRPHPGVVLTLKRPGEPAARFLYSDEIRFPARPGDWNPAGIERHPRFGEIGSEVPLSLRHALPARRAVDALQDYFLVACDFQPKGPGATEREALAAHSIANGIGTTVSRFETIASRSPEAKLVVEVYDGLVTGKLKATADVTKAIAALDAAGRSIDGRSALSPEDRALVKAEAATVRKLADEWLHSGDRSVLLGIV